MNLAAFFRFRRGFVKMSEMKNYSFWISIIAVILSFAGGFLLANALNKSEIEKIRVENAGLKNSASNPAEKSPESDLSSEEISQKIAESEQHANDFKYQKNLGIALARYASMKNDPNVSAAAEKILGRAVQLNGVDADVLIALGNLNFDLGFSQKDNLKLDKAREFYQKVLDKKPEDASVRTDAALTYYLKNPPDFDQAIAELNKSLQIDSKNEKTLQFLIQSYLKTGRQNEAQTALDKLKVINPTTPTLKEIAAQIEQNESKTGN